MDAFLAVTGSAETNILACLTAKKLGVKKVICEVENFDTYPMLKIWGLILLSIKK
jgi:trk system potassium uptake protein